jgi:hypothetical protein
MVESALRTSGYDVTLVSGIGDFALFAKKADGPEIFEVGRGHVLLNGGLGGDAAFSETRHAQTEDLFRLALSRL